VKDRFQAFAFQILLAPYSSARQRAQQARRRRVAATAAAAAAAYDDDDEPSHSLLSRAATCRLGGRSGRGVRGRGGARGGGGERGVFTARDDFGNGSGEDASRRRQIARVHELRQLWEQYRTGQIGFPENAAAERERLGGAVAEARAARAGAGGAGGGTTTVHDPW
jgi:hypothetical protein